MTKLEAALLDVVGFLEERGVRYMVIGGFANLHWGKERFTRDLDITVEVADGALADVVDRLQRRFTFMVTDPLEFARRNHLMRLQTPSGVDVDLMLAVLPYESAAIRRALPLEVGGQTVRLCTAEDLIIHKLASERPQDAFDVEGIILRQSRGLDRDYLDPLVRQLASGLERPALLDFYRSCLERAASEQP